jgi:HSP90 family molecular chaperone
MIRMMKAMGQDVPSTKKTLMINPDNILVQKYISLFETQPESEKVSLFVSYLYEQALLLE